MFIRFERMFNKLHGIFRNTEIQTGIAVPLDYLKLAEISYDVEEETNSAIANFQTSDSFLEDIASTYMV